MAMPTCRRLERQLALYPAFFAETRAGRSKPARTAIIAMTTSSSSRVKACLDVAGELISNRRKNYCDPLSCRRMKVYGGVAMDIRTESSEPLPESGDPCGVQVRRSAAL